jgi:hypothetical protein
MAPRSFQVSTEHQATSAQLSFQLMQFSPSDAMRCEQAAQEKGFSDERSFKNVRIE